MSTVRQIFIFLRHPDEGGISGSRYYKQFSKRVVGVMKFKVPEIPPSSG